MTEEHKLKTPLKKEDVAKLRIGDIVYVSGEVFTSRDRTQRLILESKNKGKLPFSLEGLIEYHAGPIVRKKNSKWEIVSLGPTTSFRMEAGEYDFIKETGIAGIIGKGGMGNKTKEACKEFKAFYGVLPGGAAALLSKKVEQILGVYWLKELGVPEAMWHLKVKDLGPIIIAIDSHGNDIYDSLKERVDRNLSRLLQVV
ncbi:MAG: FumA C-terminus/TtdB family hydratase beta subunit [Crenarchaeota archaeon]|nr:FumA C-terminus/TtdB family hydratase beta subunit [Thermoproteota archaeon]MDW8034611.1 FumA C-terminus/TtdB family hydratase beta subunit [Nitrososphaerota archaeon]